MKHGLMKNIIIALIMGALLLMVLGYLFLKRSSSDVILSEPLGAERTVVQKIVRTVSYDKE